MRIKLLLGLVFLIVTNVSAFWIGAVRSQKATIADFAFQFENADAFVLLGHYTGYRDIALALAEEDRQFAMCQAELGATMMYDGLMQCLQKEGCRSAIEVRIRSSAPELLNEAPPPIQLRKSCSKGPAIGHSGVIPPFLEPGQLGLRQG